MQEEHKIMEMAVNNCINYSREMVKQIDHAKRTNDGLEDIKTLVFAAMVAYYGIDHIDDVYVAFLKTDFVRCGDISQMLQSKYKLSSDVALTASSQCPGTFYDATAIKKLDTDKYRIKRKIYVSDEASIDILIRSVAYQVNRVINSIRNSVLKKRREFGSRMGLSFEYFYSRRTESVALENAINKLQINEIMNELERFGLYDIEDEAVKVICDSLFSSKKSEEEADDVIMQIVRPLYEDKFFNSVLVDKRLSGDLMGIKNTFEFNCEPGGYSRFLTACEKLSRGNLSEDEASSYEEDAKSLVKKYISKVSE